MCNDAIRVAVMVTHSHRVDDVDAQHKGDNMTDDGKAGEAMGECVATVDETWRVWTRGEGERLARRAFACPYPLSFVLMSVVDAAARVMVERIPNGEIDQALRDEALRVKFDARAQAIFAKMNGDDDAETAATVDAYEKVSDWLVDQSSDLAGVIMSTSAWRAATNAAEAFERTLLDGDRDATERAGRGAAKAVVLATLATLRASMGIVRDVCDDDGVRALVGDENAAFAERFASARAAFLDASGDVIKAALARVDGVRMSTTSTTNTPGGDA